MQKHKKKLVIFSTEVFLLVLVVVAIFNITKVSADQPPWDETNVSGWNWSGIATENSAPGVPDFTHIGWFSNNCYNYFSTGMESRCGADFGVRVDPVTGNISGYSWNGILDDSGAVTGVGWLDFDPQPFPGPPYYEARIEPVGSTYEGQVSGWARIKSIKEQGEYLGYEDWGWILLGPEPGPNRQFGVNIDSSNVSGYAWAGGYLAGDQLLPDPYENVTTGLGWISFDTGLAHYYTKPAIEGYAWMGNSDALDPSFDANIGWVSLNCKTGGVSGNDICATSDYKVFIDNTTGEISGYAWIGESSDGNPIGWINFDPNPYPADPNYSAKVFLEQQTAIDDPYGTYQKGDVVGWARLVSLKKEGAKGHFENWGWVKMHTSGTEVEYGVSMDTDSGIFDGYAWSGGGTVCVGAVCYDNSVGLGWISFQDYSGVSQLPPTYVAPFLETVQGDIYSKVGVGSDEIFSLPTSPLTSELFYNSTFLIQSGGDIERYSSENVTAQDIANYWQNYPESFEPPLATNKYSNVMGKLDVDGIASFEPVGSPPVNKNKFGTIVEESSGDTLIEDLWSDGFSRLQGKVYYIHEGDLTINIPMIIDNGNDVTNDVASGTFIVDGDMFIEKDITYDSLIVGESYAELEDIPSVAWIVKGNVYVSPNVAEVVGSFVVVGKEKDGALEAGTGEFYSGAGDVNLIVNGLVVAHELFLQRSGIGTVENIQASESIFYDGRIIINTPPGVGDFAKALPVVREVAPIEISP
ncbi:hypothetical protein KJ810_02480 [Patescibacteria group bacterium]|nr:hypothetical protein [Patescibacteria group bacterium]